MMKISGFIQKSNKFLNNLMCNYSDKEREIIIEKYDMSDQDLNKFEKRERDVSYNIHLKTIRFKYE